MALTRLFAFAGLLGVVAGGAVDSAAAPVGTAFAYQGQLKDGGAPANGNIAMIFRLFDGPDSATQIGDDVEQIVGVVNGLFTVNLDFGPAAFDGEERWLEAEIDGVPLSPRQPITPAPYALHAAHAASNWQDIGDDVSLPTGNAGIGTAEPTAMLHLHRPYQSTSIRFQSVRFDQGAPTSSVRGPGSAAVSGTGVTWNNPGAALATDDLWATTNLSEALGEPDPDQSVFLDLTAAGFSIPAGGEVTGVTVQTEGHVTASCSDCERAPVTLTAALLGGPAASQPRNFQFGPSDTVVAMGGTVDMWGVDWTPAQINGAGFGVRLSASLVLGNQTCFPAPLGCVVFPCDCTGSGTAFVDAVTVTVFYFDTPTTSSPVEWSLGMSPEDKNLRFAPTPDVSTPTMIMTPQGSVGIGTAEFGGGVFKLSVNGFAAKPSGGSWSSLSDRRLKRNVEPISGALSRLLSLRGVSFEFTEQGLATGLATPGRHTGFIAQEVEPVFPEWVGDAGDGYKFITEIGSTALLVEALRELRAEQNAQIANRDARIAAMEERIRQVESLLRARGQDERREE